MDLNQSCKEDKYNETHSSENSSLIEFIHYTSKQSFIPDDTNWQILLHIHWPGILFDNCH